MRIVRNKRKRKRRKGNKKKEKKKEIHKDRIEKEEERFVTYCVFIFNETFKSNECYFPKKKELQMLRLEPSTKFSL